MTRNNLVDDALVIRVRIVEVTEWKYRYESTPLCVAYKVSWEEDEHFNSSLYSSNTSLLVKGSWNKNKLINNKKSINLIHHELQSNSVYSLVDYFDILIIFRRILLCSTVLDRTLFNCFYKSIIGEYFYFFEFILIWVQPTKHGIFQQYCQNIPNIRLLLQYFD